MPFPVNETLRLQCSAQASRATVQLFDVRPEFLRRGIRRPMPLGTGVLSHRHGHDMLLTASHILDSEFVQKYGLFIGHPTRGFIDLGNFSFVRTASDGDRLMDDDVDVAAIAIASDIAHQLTQGEIFKPWTALSADSTQTLPHPVAHLIHGFATDLTQITQGGRHLEPTSISCFLPLHEAEPSLWPARFPDSKLDFAYLPQTLTLLDGTQRSLHLPQPHGLSGCGVWQISQQRTTAAALEPTMTLVGIIHRFNRALGILRATRLQSLDALLRNQLRDIQ